MDRLVSLRVFCRVVELGSLSRAAGELDIANASVTNHLARLERHFGVRLLNRTTRRIALTDEGSSCYQRAKRPIGEFEELEETLRGAKTSPRGLLHISLPTTVARLHLAAAIPRFAARYPELTLKFSASDRIVDAVEEGVDVLIRIGELQDSNMVARTALRTWYRCGASPEFLARHGKPETPEALARFPCLGFTLPSTGRSVRWVFEKDGRRSDLLPAARLWMNHADSLLEAAAAGGGIVQLLSLTIDPAIAAGALQPVLAGWEAPGPPVSVIYPHQRHPPAKVRAFVEFVIAHFRRHAAFGRKPPANREGRAE